jgi:succinate dehydrogenase / fumarate reductase cytochrome b subunit
MTASPSPSQGSSKPQLAERPLSPHLQIYKPQLTTGMSIMHRMTGIGLTLGLLILVAWLVGLATGPDNYAACMSVIKCPLCQIVLFGLTWAFFYHFCCGVRHLLWDAGFFLNIDGVYSTGRIALGVSTLLTVILWLKILGVTP